MDPVQQVSNFPDILDTAGHTDEVEGTFNIAPVSRVKGKRIPLGKAGAYSNVIADKDCIRTEKRKILQKSAVETAEIEYPGWRFRQTSGESLCLKAGGRYRRRPARNGYRMDFVMGGIEIAEVKGVNILQRLGPRHPENYSARATLTEDDLVGDYPREIKMSKQRKGKIMKPGLCSTASGAKVTAGQTHCLWKIRNRRGVYRRGATQSAQIKWHIGA